MRAILSLLATLVLAVRRLWNHRLLMLCLLAGLVAAVGLLSSIPLYADAVQHRLLRGELLGPGAVPDPVEPGGSRSPFAFLWRYVGIWHGEVAWDEFQPVDQYLSLQAPRVIDLPLPTQVRHVRTDNLRLFGTGDGAFEDRDPLMWTSLGFISGLQDHITLLQGGYPSDAGPDLGVLASRSLAERMGLQVGERYVLLAAGEDGAQLPVQVAGIWQASDPSDPYWFYQPESFDEVLLASEAAYTQLAVPQMEEPVSLAVWHQVYDGSRVRSAMVPQLLQNIATAQARADALLPNAALDISPVEALGDYQQAARLLTVMLTAFAVPIVGLVLYFVALIAGMVVRRSQAEIAILRSRGTTRFQILLDYGLEGLLVGGVGLAGGLALGYWLAQTMGRTRTFLAPAALAAQGACALPAAFGPSVVGYGLLAVALALGALLLPALLASRHTIVTFRWERARALVRPLWQRAYLDILLLALPAYGWYLLNQQGAITQVGRGQDAFSNPLLFLVPALFCFSLALLFARIFPLIMRVLAALASVFPWTTPLLALRQLARSASLYTGPLLLLSLTLSLATFTASMAATLDGHLVDRVYYEVGADLNLAEQGESTEEPDQASLLSGVPATTTTTEEEEGLRWLFLPVSEHLRVPGVRAAARVGDYAATSNIGGSQQTVRLLGVDRIQFPAVAFFRHDFAGGEPVAGLMNRLAAERSSILVSRDFLARHGLSAGDPLRLTVGVAGEFQPIDFTVVGALDLFPTLYPQDGSFFVANLEYIYEGLGGTYPYDVWLATDPEVAGVEIVDGVRGLGLALASASDARATIVSEQTQPERQGLFGLLSAGFLAAAVLTVLGFLVYAVVSFQQRFIELGMLRAVGLSVVQMAGYLAGEQAVLVLTGGALGSALGIAASLLFIPFMQVGAGKTAVVPPFVVTIAWDQLWIIYAVFGAIYLLAVLVLVILLVRMRIFEAVKLGEAN